jgi:hypothetical protein
MSSNSNLGYSHLSPYTSGQFTNANSTQYAGNFGSNETNMKGGFKNEALKNGALKNGVSIKRKIKNITKKYRKMSKKGTKRMKQRIRSKYLSKARNGGKSKSKLNSRRLNSRKLKGGWIYRKSRRHSSSKQHKKLQHGGYSQYGSNMIQPSNYSVGGNLLPSQSSLANPPPFVANSAEVDNYNHFTKSGFQ